jgi:hypothetical protein
MGLLQVLNLRPRKAKGKLSPRPEKLSQAADAWRETHREANERIAALKASIQAHYADGHPELVQAIDKGLDKLDEVLDNVDHRLADSLASAGKADSDGARAAELKNAKAILTGYINYVKSEPLVAHIDRNPFEVKTDLKVLLVGGLTDAAKAIG